MKTPFLRAQRVRGSTVKKLMSVGWRQRTGPGSLNRDSEVVSTDTIRAWQGSPNRMRPGGGGYSFEDAVAAWCLLHMLSGRPPLGPALGQVLRVDWQAKENWLH